MARHIMPDKKILWNVTYLVKISMSFLRIPDFKSLVSRSRLVQVSVATRLFAPSLDLVVSKSRLGLEDFG